MKSKYSCIRLEVSLEDKISPETYDHHSQDDIQMDERPTKIQVQKLQIASWTLIEVQQFVKLNLGKSANPQYINVNSQLTKQKTKELQMLLKEFKDVFAQT